MMKAAVIDSLERGPRFADFAESIVTGGETRGALLRVAGTGGRPSRRGGSAVPQPECGQHQARKCYQRAGYLKGVAV